VCSGVTGMFRCVCCVFRCACWCVFRCPPPSLLNMPTGVMPLSLMMQQNNLALMRSVTWSHLLTQSLTHRHTVVIQPGVDEVCHVVTPSHPVTHSPSHSRHTAVSTLLIQHECYYSTPSSRPNYCMLVGK